MIKISYDQEGDILEIRFSEEPISNSEYVEESGLVLDYNDKGNIVGLEIISFSTKVSKYQEIKSMAI